MPVTLTGRGGLAFRGPGKNVPVRAEMRMADEIDKGQAEGTVAKKGDVQGPDIATLDTLGLDRRRVAE